MGWKSYFIMILEGCLLWLERKGKTVIISFLLKEANSCQDLKGKND